MPIETNKTTAMGGTLITSSIWETPHYLFAKGGATIIQSDLIPQSEGWKLLGTFDDPEQAEAARQAYRYEYNTTMTAYVWQAGLTAVHTMSPTPPNDEEEWHLVGEFTGLETIEKVIAQIQSGKE